MKVLLIGGSGCMGAPLANELLKAGHELTLLNRGRTQKPPKGAEAVVCDRKDSLALAAFARKAVYFDCAIDMLSFTRQDARGGIEAFRGRCGQYVFCSTVDVFSKEPPRYPLREDSERNARESFAYAYEKMKSEFLYEQAEQEGAFRLTIVRPAATYREGYGVPLSDIGSPALALSRLRSGKPILLHGDGTSIWIETYADDVARAIANAVGNPAAMGRSYNIMGDEYFTWQSYWRMVASAANAPEPPFVFIPASVLHRGIPAKTEICIENFSHNNPFDNARAKEELGFVQTVLFEEGARRCVKWLEENTDGTDLDEAWYDQIIADWEASCDRFCRKQEAAASSGGVPD